MPQHKASLCCEQEGGFMPHAFDFLFCIFSCTCVVRFVKMFFSFAWVLSLYVGFPKLLDLLQGLMIKLVH